MAMIPLDWASLAIGGAFVLGILVDRAWFIWTSRD